MADMIRALDGARPHLRERRVDLLQDRDASRATASSRASTTTGIKAGARVDSDNYDKENARDFVLWKATKAGRADVGPRRRSRASRLAHRVLGDGAAPARRAADRHPRRRRRPDLPAPRERDRAERGRDRRAVLALLGARRAPADRRARRCRSRSATSSTCRTSSTGASAPSALRYLLLSIHYRKQLKFTLGQPAAGRGGAAAARPTSSPGSTRVHGGRRPRRRRARAWRRRRAAFADALDRRPEHRRRRSASMFDLVRALNTAIDDGELGARRRRGRARTRSSRFDRVLGVLAPAARRGRAAAGRRRRDRAADRGAPAPRAAPRLRRGRPHPRRPRRARHPPRGRRGRHAVEAEVTPETTMNAPDIKTPLPGPKAAAIIARDEQLRLAVLHPRLPARHGRRRRARSSRTSTATASSTAPPASPSTPPGTPTRRS